MSRVPGWVNRIFWFTLAATFFASPLLGLSLVLIGSLLGPWLEDGYVRIEPGSEHLELTGTPGDRIKLLLPLPADHRADYRETSVVLRDPETGEETVTRLEVKLDDDEAPALGAATLEQRSPVFAWLTVPGLSDGTSRTLNGTLSGYATTRTATLGRFEVPLTLRIGPRGSVATSGAKDMTRQNRVMMAVLLAHLAIPLAMGIALARSFHRFMQNGTPVSADETVRRESSSPASASPPGVS